MQLLRIISSAILGFTGLAVAALDDICGPNGHANYKDGITTRNSPLYEDCEALIASLKFVQLTKDEQYKEYTHGTCKMTFHLGSSDAMMINHPSLVGLWNLITPTCTAEFGNDPRWRIETFGDIICGRSVANFEMISA
ncbi:hypothetical protein QBC43DRAFT_289986 [Cladorrhinum sp. PSN259]|nr:hypothetical protein QBC43DRAFT_289986 [Cladorrhinum sp. PSN259]